MQALRQLGGGVIIAIVSIILVIGGISLALAESAPPPVIEQTPTPIPPTVQLFPTFLTTPLIASTQTETPASTATLAIAPTLPPVQPATCTIPAGWIQVTVGSNDTIYSLAQRYNTTEGAIVTGNCLTSANLQPSSTIYVPFVPTVVVIQCSPPARWVRTHIVQPGDNLFRIALSYGLTFPQLQQGNCMGSSTTIYAGQRLWVPNIPTRTPLPGVTNTLVFPSSTASFTPVPPTFAQPPSPTSTFISTSSPVPTASNTPAPTPTFTPSITPFPPP
ncbi:MAG TPA: LysM peptidoglycan-binding domain-containing protein [Anaerolineales bacterium]|nr:LysM peptidoglycan-binding domain-containing protein [Anaerolineales bacterium]